MNRRELLKMIAAATGGAMIGGEFFLTGCKSETKSAPVAFTDENIAFLDEVAETILPQTNTAGAKAAGVGRFMTVMVNDCYTKDDQEIFCVTIIYHYSHKPANASGFSTSSSCLR